MYRYTRVVICVVSRVICKLYLWHGTSELFHLIKLHNYLKLKTDLRVFNGGIILSGCVSRTTFYILFTEMYTQFQDV